MAQQKDENTVHLRGRATKDAESKFTTTGKMITKFGIATSFGKDKTEFHNVEAWSSEFAASIKKGGVVDCWGYLKTNTWEKDGKKNYMTVVVANKFIDAPLQPATASPISDEITDDDIPF